MLQLGDCFADIARPTYPIDSTNQKHKFVTTQFRESLIDLHMPPIRNGIKYHVLLLSNWNRCKSVVIENRAMNITAAGKEGL